MDIRLIPTDELLSDRRESIADIAVCKRALLHGIEQSSGGSVQRRLDVNRAIVEKIDAEMARRESRNGT